MVRLIKGEYLGAVHSTASAAGVLMGITNYQDKQAVTPMHYHENAHLSFVLKGEMSVKRKQLTGTQQALESFSFMHSGEIHQTAICSTKCKNLNLEFEPEFFFAYGIQERDITQGLRQNRPDSVLLMARLYKEFIVNDMCLADSVHMLLLSATAVWKDKTHKPPLWVKIVRELMNDRWDEQVSLNEVAAAAMVHPVTLSKYFTRYFGVSFGEYRRKLKIEKAISLITAGDLSLTEVGFVCGFSDQSHFIRTFKDYTSMLPGDFRSA